MTPAHRRFRSICNAGSPIESNSCGPKSAVSSTRLGAQPGRGVVSRAPVPLGTEQPGTGSQLYAGALKNEQRAGMQEALHQYRDEASQKVRDFSGFARSEGPAHAEYRRIQGLDGPVLRLDREGRETLGRWRQRESPIPNDPDPVRVDNDRTANQPEIAPLETETGLSWEAAMHGAVAPPRSNMQRQ